MNTPNFDSAYAIVIQTSEKPPVEIHGGPENKTITFQETKEGLHICSDGFLICLPPRVTKALKEYLNENIKETEQ